MRVIHSELPSFFVNFIIFLANFCKIIWNELAFFVILQRK